MKKRIVLALLAIAGFIAVLQAQEMMFGQGATYPDIIRNDHQQISALLEQLKTNDRAIRKTALAQLKDGITRHMKAEESYIYSQLEKNPDTKAIAVRAEDEHMAAKAQLMKMDPMDEDQVWNSHLEVLTMLIKTHVEFEEGKLLDAAKQAIADEPKATEQFKKLYR